MRQFSLLRPRSRLIPVTLTVLAGMLLTLIVLLAMSVLPQGGGERTVTPSDVQLPAAKEQDSATPGPKAQPEVLQVGGQVEVYGTDSCLNIREAPNLASAIKYCLRDGTTAALADGPRDSDGMRWWKLGEYEGWATEAYLRPSAVP